MSRWLATWSSPALAVLTYHHFAATDGPATRQLGMTTGPERFRRQLDYIAARYQPIDLDRLLSGNLPPRAILVTIDDAYRSVIEVAAPMLKARAIPAVLFANPRPIVEPFVLTDHVLSFAMSTVAGQLAVAAAVKAVRGEAPADAPPLPVNQLRLREIAEVKQRVLSALAVSEGDLHHRLGLYLVPTDLAKLAAYGIEVANHTFSHTLCRTLSPAEQETEIAGAKAVLETLTRRPVRAFAFPWGREVDASAPVMAAIRESGHLASFLMHGRRNTVRPAPDIWYRTLGVNQSPTRLAIDLEVVPGLRSLRRARASTSGPK